MTFAMGPLDLIFEITLDEKYLGDKKIEDLKSLKDISFIKDKNKILNTIKLKPNNEFVKQVLLGNIISKKKMFRRFKLLWTSEI